MELWLIIAAVALVGFGIFQCYRFILTIKVKRLKKSFVAFIDEVDAMRDPNSPLSSSQVDKVTTQYKPVFDKALPLFDSGVLSDDVKADTKLTPFIDTYRGLHHLPIWNQRNNSFFVTIFNLLDTSKIDYQNLFRDNHYFAGSEMDAYIEKYAPLKIAIESSQSENSFHYLTSSVQTDCKQFLFNLKSLAAERDKHNANFKKDQLALNSSYFDSVLAYPLDAQQRDAIVTLEDNTQVISAAGGGKTTTIVGKIKYLIEKRNYDPASILLITYTRKATEELNRRLPFDGLNCVTFHSLAVRIIGAATGRKPSICENNLLARIYDDLISTPGFLASINHYLLELMSMMKNEHQYTDSKVYFADRKKYGVKAMFKDMDGRTIYTKSEQERKICHFLSCHGISFRYEANYPYGTASYNYRQYKPDFTIYYTVNGQQQVLFLEHFAIDAQGKVPPFFREKGSWFEANRRYNEGIVWKRNLHRQKGTALIETTSAMFNDGSWKENLTRQLRAYGIPVTPLTDEQIYANAVRSRHQMEDNIIALISSFINLMKSNFLTLTEIRRKAETNKDQRTLYIINHIISPMFQRYCDALTANSEIDFTDAIIQATELCKRNPGLASYDYILVDEFQDISKDRYELLKSLRHQSPLTKLFCVGDDWQSIFRFSGSDMALFYDFAKFFGHTAECRIETTYRFGNPLIAKSSEFILKNENQKQKTVKSVSRDKRTFIHVHQYDNDELQARQVANLVANVPTDQSILILGRYGFSHNSLIFNSQGLISCSSNGADRVSLKIGGRECEFMTVHKAKGLEADVVILINCSSDIYGFPSNISDDPILNYLLSASDTFEFAEERRLFYVAITRARKDIHVLFDRKSPSVFVGEFQNIPEADICPQCGIGQRTIQKQGVAKNGHPYITYVCSNNDGCDYLETVFDNNIVIAPNQ